MAAGMERKHLQLAEPAGDHGKMNESAIVVGLWYCRSLGKSSDRIPRG